MLIKTKLRLLLPIILIFLLIPFAQSVAQKEEPAPPNNLLPEMLRDAYKNAIKNIESERKEEEKKTAAELEAKLQSAAKEWIASSSEKRNAGINKLILPDWKGLPEPQPKLPFPHYLRDFEYIAIGSDISKTASYTSPYKASVKLLEKLYVEKYHSASPSYPKEYLYTITTPITLTFEYTQEVFTLRDKKDSDIAIEKGWPEKLEPLLKDLDK